ncbi:MAG: hypothetical protein EVB11_12375 [Winogradskyella sp.]|nr:MAG: hypothetical protein EVB11_12375 [Winogradskyella sp.]
MKNIETLKKLISNKDYSDFSSIQNSLINTRELISRIEKGKIFDLLDADDKSKLESYTQSIINEFKNFDATKNEDIHLQLDYFLFKNYNLIFQKLESFENKFTKSISDLNAKLISSKEALKKLSIESEKTNKELKASLESSQKTNKELDQLRKDAIKKVNDFASKIKDENQRKLDLKLVEISNTVNNQKNQWNKKFDELDIKRQKFEKLYEEATTYFSESRFDKYSNDERSQANVYRKISIILMLFVVFFIVSLTVYSIHFDKSNPKWYDYITRSLLIFTLMIPAIYTSRESSRHRRNSDKYTQMANELKAFKITLEVDDLSVEIKNKVKEEIYKRYFGNLLFDESKDIGDSISDFYGKFGKKSE